MVFLLSLERIALVKVAVSIYNNPEMRDLVRNCNRHHCLGLCCFDKRELFIRQKASNCAIPKSLLENVLRLIQPIHHEFQRFRKIHYDDFDIDFGQLKNICWNSIGSIDYEETAKILVRSEEFSCLSDFLSLAITG
ncbi:hypothetical protein NPIL_158631 [Nephila pilipes]|uniref:Uncharacterized protein n=1 Tax=Nephila pilipes TaxID=299642 RepID=A0A8X6PI80_NEPPI|nr:hypothetical protein NPIL_158631 [Nephila pilipes]